jgi:lysozyme
VNEHLREQLIRHEGLRLKPYRDTVGKLTIGVGRNLDDVGLTKAEAMAMLDRDIDVVRDELRQFDWYKDQNNVRKDVLANMAFNMGTPTVLKFKGMISGLEAGDYQRAALEMLDSKWARQVGKRATELQMLMVKGRYD